MGGGTDQPKSKSKERKNKKKQEFGFRKTSERKEKKKRMHPEGRTEFNVIPLLPPTLPELLYDTGTVVETKYIA